MRFSALLLCLAAVGACATLEGPDDGGGDPLRPQPLPEPSRYPTLEPTRVHLQRNAEGLEVTGGAGAADGTDVRVVVTELRRGAPPFEVSVATDRSFSAQLATTGATDVQLSPVVDNAVGSSLVLHIDEAGVVTEVPAPCLTGSTGLVLLGPTARAATTADASVRLVNDCQAAVTVNALTVRDGRAFTLGVPALPVVLQPGAELSVHVDFAPASSEAPRAAAHYDVVDVVSTPVTGLGFVVRAPR